MTKFIFNNRTDVLQTDIDLFFTITNCRIARSRALTRRMNFKLMCLSVSVRILTIKISQWARVNFCIYRKKIDTQCTTLRRRNLKVRQYPILPAKHSLQDTPAGNRDRRNQNKHSDQDDEYNHHCSLHACPVDRPQWPFWTAWRLRTLLTILSISFSLFSIIIALPYYI